MRISDWSSDVCSSDLSWRTDKPASPPKTMGAATNARLCHLTPRSHTNSVVEVKRQDSSCRRHSVMMARRRSEEHTSELQSLMRISYAVFCLKKKRKTTQNKRTHKRNTTKPERR